MSGRRYQGRARARFSNASVATTNTTPVNTAATLAQAGRSSDTALTVSSTKMNVSTGQALVKTSSEAL